MRKKTFAGLCVILTVATVLGLKVVAGSYAVRLPLFGNLSPLIAAVIILPVLFTSLGAVNQYVLAWRKAHGRDIQEEEKHEFEDADLISLRPRQEHEHSSAYRRGDLDD